MKLYYGLKSSGEHMNGGINWGLVAYNHYNPESQHVQQQLRLETLERKAKLGLVRKLYLILICQLSFIALACFYFYFSKPFFHFQASFLWATLIFVCLSVLFLLVSRCTTMGRHHPFALAILLLITTCFSYIITYTTSLYANVYGGSLLVEALAVTIVLVIVLTAYAHISDTNYITEIGIVIVVLIQFIFLGIVCAVQWNSMLYSLYCTIGAIIAEILLIINTQMIVGGERSFQVSLDDYVQGALILYADIVRLFQFLEGNGRRKELI